MVFFAYPPTRKQLAVTAGVFAAGICLIAVGLHLSYANIGPQQAKVKARRDFVKARLRNFLDD